MSDRGGIIIICKPGKTISEIMYNNLNLHSNKLKGSKITELFIASDKQKAENFINSILQKKTQFNWELNILCENKIRTLPFHGFRLDDKLILTGGLSGKDIYSLYDAITRINNSQVNYLRTLAKKISAYHSQQESQEQESLDRLSQLNNELSNLQRKLMKQNLEYKKLSQKLQRISVTDELTQVANRRHFNTHLKKEWKRAVREKKPISFIIFDVDYFKIYNDTHGHLEGDKCLQKIAAELKENIKRPADLLARYGGDEFAVVLPNTDKKGLLYLANNCHKQVQKLNIANKKSPVSDRVTITVGATTMHPKDGMKSQKLIKLADRALYKAKEAGRNRVKYENE